MRPKRYSRLGFPRSARVRLAACDGLASSNAVRLRRAIESQLGLVRTASTRLVHSSTTLAGAGAGFDTLPAVTPLPWPRWRTPLSTESDTAIRHWEEERNESQGSYAGPQEPVVVGSLVVTAEDTELVVRSLADGTVLHRQDRAPSHEKTSHFDAVRLRLTTRGDRVYTAECSCPAGGEISEQTQHVAATQVRLEGVTRLWSTPIHGELLGPPTPSPFGLFALARDRTVTKLIKLTQAGEIVFEQPLAIGDVTPRRRNVQSTAIDVVVCEGVVVCTTRLGQVVAVNADDGSICWVDYDPARQPSDANRPASSVCRQHGEVAYPTPTIVADGTVVLLPPDSPLVHAIDLQTGVVRWRTDRKRDSALLGEVDGRVFLTGDRSVRALDLLTGDECWSQQIDTPTGRGIVVGSTLAIPQPDGRLLSVHQSDGTILHQPYRDDSLSRSERSVSVRHRRMGNLVRTPGGVVWASPTTLAVHAFAESRTARNATPEAEPSVEQARVLLATGRMSDAVAMLKRTTANAAEQGAWNHLMRESLFAQLRASNGQHQQAMTSLAPLMTSEAHSTRLLLHQLRGALVRRDWTAAVSFASDLALRDETGPITQDGVERSPGVAAMSLLLELSDADRRQVVPIVAASLASSDERTRQTLVPVFAALPLPASFWTQQAEWHLRLDRPQFAELALLAAVQADQVSQTRIPDIELADFYEQFGRPREAAAIWKRLHDENEFAKRTPNARVRELPRRRSGSLRVERARIEEATALGRDVQIEVETVADALWAAEYADDRRKIRLPTGTIDLVDVSDRMDAAETTLRLLDRCKGRRTGEVQVPKHYWHPPGYRPAIAGHVLPLGATQPVAVSLLTGRSLWQSTLESTRKFKVAFAGPKFVVLQDRNRLVALRTGTGEVAWSRSDLDRHCGLMASESSGVTADAAQTVVFDSGGRTFTRYSTTTGTVLGQGRIEPDGRPLHRPEFVVGHRVAYAVFDQGQWRLRGQDLSTESPRHLFDTVVGPRPLMDRVNDDEFVVVNESGELISYDLASATENFVTAAKFDPATTASLTAAVTSTELLLNPVPAISSRPEHYALTSTDVRLPHVNLDGDLIACDRATGEPLWTRAVGKATLLDTFDTASPVLLVFSRTPPQGGAKSMRLDVIDRRNGEVVASRTGLPRTPLLRGDYDAIRGEVRIAGRDAMFRVQLGGPLYTVSR